LNVATAAAFHAMARLAGQHWVRISYHQLQQMLKRRSVSAYFLELVQTLPVLRNKLRWRPFCRVSYFSHRFIIGQHIKRKRVCISPYFASPVRRDRTAIEQGALRTAQASRALNYKEFSLILSKHSLK
jgi:hypothetical protein